MKYTTTKKKDTTTTTKMKEKKDTTTKMEKKKPEVTRFAALFVFSVLINLMICTVCLSLLNLGLGKTREELRAKENFNENVNEESLKVLRHNESTCGESQVRVLFCIKSHIGNVKKRKALREAWLSEIKDSKLDTFAFVIGTAQAEIDPKPTFLLDEEDKFGDIVQGNFLDTYRNLTIKSAFLLKWAHDFCPQAEYVMSVDDDTFVNLKRLEIFLSKVNHKVDLLAGYVLKNRKPFRNELPGRNASDEGLPSVAYPTYTTGSGYIMSSDVVSKLQNCTMNEPLFHSDDVFATGVCGHNVSMLPYYTPRFNMTSWLPQSCFWENATAVPDMTAEEITQFWDQYKHQRYFHGFFCFADWSELVLIIFALILVSNACCFMFYFFRSPQSECEN